MKNTYELHIRIFKDVEGMPSSLARVMYSTPDGSRAINIPFGRDAFPESDIAFLLCAKIFLETAIKNEKKQAGEYRDG